MTITLELPENLEAEVAEEAAEHGMTREAWLRLLIERHLAERTEPQKSTKQPTTNGSNGPLIVAKMPAKRREELNLRRVELIRRDIEGELSEEEAAELTQLQQAWEEYLNTVAPLPWDKLEELRKANA